MLWSPRWAWHHVGTILCCLDSLPILSLASLLAVVQLFFFSFSFSGCAGSSLWHSGISSVARGFCGPPGMCDLSFPTRDTTHVSRIGRWILNHWPTREGLAGMFSMTHSMAGTVLGTEDMKVNNTRSYLSWSS